MKYYGADYYPEQEEWEEIERDAVRMREQGFNAVRIGEFAWSVLEPRDGEFHMDWLRRVIEILGSQGISTIVCTPTACPPIWLVEKYPEILYRDNRGVTRPFGGRRHYCYNNADYRRYCARIAEKIAQAVAGLPQVIGLHIDNELAQEATGRCQCPACRALFHRWLQRKYGTIEEWNRRAGTVFWSQTYQRFDQIPLPVKSAETEGEDNLHPFMDNPTLRLEFERFCSDSMVDFVELQADVLRRFSSLPLTTNTTGVWTSALNYYDAFRRLDKVAVDEYPSLRYPDLYGSSFSYAFIRGVKGKESFWVVETSSGGGQGVWARQGVLQPYPGSLELAAIHAAAHGAELLAYFQYKTFRYGAEQLEAAVLDIDGVERRRNREMRHTAAELKRLEPLLAKTELKNRAAVVFDYDSLWAIRIKPFHKEYTYQTDLMRWHTLLSREGIGADVVPLDSTIFRYALLVLPTAVILSKEHRELLKAYVREGGVLLATFLSGIKNEDNTADRAGIPSGLTDLFGLRVGEGDPVYEGVQARIKLDLPGRGVCSENRFWTECLELDGAEPLGVYDNTFRRGECVAAINRYGNGKACYLGTGLSDEATRALLRFLYRQAGYKPVPFRLSNGTEAIVRFDGERPVYFLLNAGEEVAEIEFETCCTDCLTEEKIQGVRRFGPKEWMVCREEGPPSLLSPNDHSANQYHCVI